MTRPIINLDELEYGRWSSRFSAQQQPPTDRYGADVAPIGARIGARKLGYNVTSIDPGKAAYPAHSHRMNEEMFMVLEGQGELRLGEERHAVRQGDIIACPPGGPETAHQLRNTGRTPLKVLSVSTLMEAEVVHYPDSGKTGFAVMATGADGKPQFVRGLALDEGQPLYWDGE